MKAWDLPLRLVRCLIVAATISCLAAAPASAGPVIEKAAPVKSTPAAPLRILALGDSLTAGYGLTDLKDAFPAQLEKALAAKGHAITVLPGGVSGDTTTGGLNRLDWSLAQAPDAVIVELGANDGLRAVDPNLTADNLRAIVRRIKRDGTPVLLTGMMAPPNLGRAYGDKFNAVFPTVAKETGVLFYPFFLEGVVAVPTLNQDDRMHPTPGGVAEIVKRILPHVEKLIAQAEAVNHQKALP